MYYDADDKQVGIKPVSDKDADDAAYTVSKTDSGGTIAPKAFLERFELTPDVTTQYLPDWDDDQELVIIDLEAPTGSYGSPDGEEKIRSQ